MSRVALTCPTFWGPPSDRFYDETTQIYDHPIPIDEEGCLGRFLDSADVIEGDFDVVLVSSSSSEHWEDEVDDRVAREIREADVNYNIYHFTHEDAATVRSVLEDHVEPEVLETVDMYGYSEIRNMCMLACHILGHELVVSTDDDVVYDDPEYLEKAQEYINTEVDDTGEVAKVVAGPYYNDEGSVEYAGTPPSWMAYWNNAEAMNEAFDRYIFGDPRLKETSYVVMGNIVLHRDFFTTVPLDPGCHRGEDMDWLINSRIFGYRFYMDRDLRVQHQPPPRGYPLWKLVRLDIERFMYDRKKVRQMEEKLGIPKDYFKPWPGRFLDEDLEDRIYRTNMMLSNQFLIDDEPEDAQGCLDNIMYAQSEYDPGDPLDSIQNYQARWERLMDAVEEHRGELSERVFDQQPVTA